MAKPETPSSTSAVNASKSTVNGEVTGQSSQPVTKVWVDTFQGGPNPLWRNQVRIHSSATTAASGFKRNLSFGDGSLTVTALQHRKSDGALISTAVIDASGPQLLPGVLQNFSVDPLGLSLEAASRAAKTKILAQITQTYRRFQGGVFLGELGESIRMIKSPLRALRNGIDSYHTSVKKRLAGKGSNRSRGRVVQDTWLEYVFGWKPLINDVGDAARALGEKDFREFVPISGYGQAVSSTTSSDTTSVNTVPVKRVWTSTSRASCLLRGECGSSPASTRVGNMNRWGFGSWREALPTAWELIPYSFLVDYFTNVGNIVDSFATQLGGVQWVNASLRVETELKLNSFDLDWNALGDSPWTRSDSVFRYSVEGGNGSYSGYVNRCTRFERANWVPSDLALGLRDLSFRAPGAGSLKWLNIAALWRMRH